MTKYEDALNWLNNISQNYYGGYDIDCTITKETYTAIRKALKLASMAEEMGDKLELIIKLDKNKKKHSLNALNQWLIVIARECQKSLAKFKEIRDERLLVR